MPRRSQAPRILALVALLTALPLRGATAAEPSGLRFLRDGKVRTVERGDLARDCGVRRVTIDDPHYGRTKEFLACPLADAMRAGFGIDDAALAKLDVVFRASDGYSKPGTGAVVVEKGGWLAFTDAERGTLDAPKWDPIDRRQVDPGPFYVVWSGKEQNDDHGYPWPYQLVEIELTSVDRAFPFVVPRNAAPGSAELAGFEIFKTQCISCHSINGQGGKIGPDLNVPKSIVEYRPSDQIKQYIRNPVFFRYTSMPPHEYLSDAQLDAIVAYFRAMSRDKHDPGKAM